MPFRNPGRVAGLWYLLLILVGPLRLLYIPSKLFVAGDATATIGNIVANEWLFRLGMVSNLVCAVLLIMLVLAFYRLFKDVDQRLAILVVILGGVMPATITFMNVGTDGTALSVAHGSAFLAVFDKAQRDALAMVFLHMGDRENTAAELLWGLWLLPLALLVWRSRFLPRFIAIWLAVNALAYVAVSLTGLLAPQDYDTVFKLSAPARLGELAIMLWLVIMGAKMPAPVNETGSSSPTVVG
jgi:hypothetical protein